VLTYLFRQSNADQALENLHFFDNSFHTEEQFVSSLEKKVSSLAPVSGTLEDAQRNIDGIMVCIGTRVMMRKDDIKQ